MNALPALGPVVHEQLGVELTGLAAVTVALTKGRTKYHIPRADLRRSYTDCRHAGEAKDAAAYRLLEVFDAICRHCTVVLPPGAEALWRAAAAVAGHRAWLARARDGDGAHTWMTYARHAAHLAPGEDEQIRRWLERAAGDEASAADARLLTEAWETFLAERVAFLEEYTEGCPRIGAYDGARQAVERARRSPEHAMCDRVSAAVSGPTRGYDVWHRDLDVWSTTSRAWLVARSRGASARTAAEFARDAAAGELAGAHVRDVTRLPAVASTCGAFHAGPAEWADAELAAWWPTVVGAACERLEAAFEEQGGDGSSRLLLIRDWPLTGARDEPIAYLAACPTLGPVLAFGRHRVDDYGGRSRGLSYAAVITAPAHVVAKLDADQARFHEDERRFTVGPPAAGGDADLEAARVLLREVFPFLPGDADGEDTTASETVRRERRAVRAAFPDQLQASEDPYGAHHGRRVWAPGEDGALAPLHEERLYPHQLLRLDIECGRRDERTFLASVFGSLAGVGERHIDFRPVAEGRHPPVAIPVNRLVALTIRPEWQSRHDETTWQPYESVDAREAATPSPRGGRRLRPVD
ncbi:hypothetical protein ACIBSV_48945 [Embleya sp. NPDC050154]|uniref:hypothetical protein n=1 Tax=Embleya sp. NPDC050154 TaxID=3363988 RepID=UPI003798EBD0